jgi:high-affinity iron transporter
MVGTAGTLAATALAMAVFIPSGGGGTPAPTRSAATLGGSGVTTTLHADGATRMLTVAPADGVRRQIRLEAAGTQTVDGIDVDVWQARVPTDPGIATSPMALGRLAALAGGRLPVGLGNARTPGPFDAQWSASTVYTVLTHGDDVVAAQGVSTRVAMLTGGGLTGQKTVSVGGLLTDWATDPGEDHAVTATVARSAQDRIDRTLWTTWLPAVLATAAACVVLAAVRMHRRTSKNEREPRHHAHGERGQSPTHGEIRVA